jgi:opacity protein-like surface antigen
MWRSVNLFVVAVLLFGGTGAWAAEKVAGPESAALGRHSMRVALGFMAADDESKLGDDDSAGTLIVDYEYRPHQNFAVGGELGFYGRVYEPDTAPGGFFTDPDNEIQVGTAGWVGTFRGILPLGNIDLYGGVGLGLFYSQVSITGKTNNISGTFYKSDTNLGYLMMLGVDIGIAKHHRINVEFRKLFLEGDFGALSGGDVDIGGDILAVGYQYRF